MPKSLDLVTRFVARMKLEQVSRKERGRAHRHREPEYAAAAEVGWRGAGQ